MGDIFVAKLKINFLEQVSMVCVIVTDAAGGGAVIPIPNKPPSNPPSKVYIFLCNASNVDAEFFIKASPNASRSV